MFITHDFKMAQILFISMIKFILEGYKNKMRLGLEVTHMTELSNKVLSVIRSNGNIRVSENVLLSRFSQKEIDIALSELEENGLVNVYPQYVSRTIEVI